MPLDLVVQGASLNAEHIERLSELVRAERVERFATQAVRLCATPTHEGVQQYCSQANLDYAWVESGRRLGDFRLLAIDMDSTLITIECVDEIADLGGIKREVAEITASAMRGEIDYAESLRRRVALLAGLDERFLQQVHDERVRLSPGAERLFAALKEKGIRTLLVSGGFTFFTERLKSRLGFDYTLSNTLEIADGRLTGRVIGRVVNGEEKAARLRDLRRELGVSLEQSIAFGDGANDLAMMAEAGVSIAFHAKPIVRGKATYCLDHVGLDGLLALFPP